MKCVRIRDRVIGPGQPVFVIAEAGVNHDGDPEQADRLVEAAAVAGADAVKFQIFRASSLVSPNAPKAAYQEERDPGATQFEMLARLELPASEFELLARSASERGIVFLASVFDEESLDVLVECGAPAVKLGSGEITNHPLIRAVARRGLPLLLSTGMSDLPEVEEAVDTFRGAGGRELALLHCLSAYPAPPQEANLRAIETLAEVFEVPIGFSDHTRTTAVPVAAVALGARVIEKHLTLDRSLPGPDHAASYEPEEFHDLVGAIRMVEKALGDGRKRAQPCEAEMRSIARKSVAARRRLPAGHTVGPGDLVILRPGTGIPPGEYEAVLGRRPVRDVEAGTVLEWEMFE